MSLDVTTPKADEKLQLVQQIKADLKFSETLAQFRSKASTWVSDSVKHIATLEDVKTAINVADESAYLTADDKTALLAEADKQISMYTAVSKL
ncbi:MAG: hypothetical protein KAJ19_18930 [Gammaproteobacteria bacterium]|nr:hypothetical protein [Gammaproteobacteria bacterium]